MLCFLLEEFIKRCTKWMDQSRKKEPILVSRNTSLYDQTWNFILFFERPIKVKVTHFELVCVSVCFTNHTAYGPFAFLQLRLFSEMKMMHIPFKIFAYLHNTFSCPCSHGVSWKAKSGDYKFSQRKIYTVSGQDLRLITI